MLNLKNLNLDWRLAMQRLGKDLRDDFWPDPLGLRDVLSVPVKTLARIEPKLANYRPTRGFSHGIPKPNLTIRDSIQIAGIDRLVYQALIDQLIPYVDPVLSPNVFSHRLNESDNKWIFKNSVGQWKVFLRAVQESLAKNPGSYLVVTDVAQYFESIRFRALRRQLEQILGPKLYKPLQPCAEALFECLNGWTPYDGYGLPQNVDASSFLGNCFLDYVDKRMARNGYCMFRYMDDLRIVVPTEADARKAIVRLVELLRELGLGLNSAKTEIIEPGSANLQAHLLAEDSDVTRIEAAISEKTWFATQSIVELLFWKTATLIESERTGDRIFRFCINRIATLRSNRELTLPTGESITDTIISLLVRRPAETDTFCRYLEVAPLSALHLDALETILTCEPLAVYPWQNFQLWRLISHRKLKTDKLTAKAHHLLEHEPHNPETAGAALYLGQHGDYADRRAIAELLPTAQKGFFQRCYQVAIQELHRAERSRAYQEASRDDGEAAVLGEHLSSLHEPIYVQDQPEIPIEDLADSMPSMYA